VLVDDAATLLSPGLSVDDALEREFAERVAESGTLAFRVAYGVLRRAEDAEDVAQEALLKAHRSFRSLRRRDRFQPWLVRMAFRMALDRRRGDRRRLRRDALALAPGDPPEVAESAETALERRERRAHVHAAVDALPERLRLVVLLAAIEEHDLDEVARLLEVPVGTVKSRLFRARALLAERLRWIAEDGAQP
jgi:RNA polymerase sigma-70 factor (ECF subfamily)